ncbi:MAG: hemolysin family protein [Persicimonas sp.]
MLPDVVGVALCLIGSALFSATEAALTSLSESQTRKLLEEDDTFGLRLWRKSSARVLTALLIANSLVNLTAAALATHATAILLVDSGVARWVIPAAIAAVTVLVLTFGEVIPKTLARQNAVRVARPLTRLFVAPYLLLFPFTFLFLKLGRAAAGALGWQRQSPVPMVTAEDIEHMLDLGAREGSVSTERERLLRSVFNFPDTVVREVMVPRTDIVAISAEMDFEETIDRLVECGHSRLPVYENNVDQIIGLFYAKDILSIIANGQSEEFDLSDYLRQPYFVSESKPVAELLSEFQAERMHLALVVDEFGGTAGLITLEDIIEEIFGDIQDEYDVEPTHLVPVDAHTVRADARIDLDQLEHYFSLELPDHPDYESLGGFLMAQVGGVPEPGEELHWEGLRFRVLEADSKRVMRVLVERLRDADLEREELVV